MVNILVVGYNAFDVVLPVAGFPAIDSKTAVEDIHISGGGPGATAAVALARLGAKVRLVTVLTDDLPGQMQQQELAAAGVDYSRSPVRIGEQSAKAVILVHEQTGERSIFWSRGRLSALTENDVDPAWLEGVDLLYCDGHENHAARTLATAARTRGLPVVLDGGSVREGTRELVACCTDVIGSTIFAPALTGHSRPDEALPAMRDMGPQRVAVTFGQAGCLVLHGDRIEHVPAFAIPIRDTTGAGDAFHAGYAFARARGDDFRDCFVFGSATAALKCRDWGGRRGLPTLPEVDDLMANGTLSDHVPQY